MELLCEIYLIQSSILWPFRAHLYRPLSPLGKSGLILISFLKPRYIWWESCRIAIYIYPKTCTILFDHSHVRVRWDLAVMNFYTYLHYLYTSNSTNPTCVGVKYYVSFVTPHSRCRVLISVFIWNSYFRKP